MARGAVNDKTNTARLTAVIKETAIIIIFVSLLIMSQMKFNYFERHCDRRTFPW